jgi:hypothetical protein
MKTVAVATQIYWLGFLVVCLTDDLIEPPKPGGFKRGFARAM